MRTLTLKPLRNRNGIVTPFDSKNQTSRVLLNHDNVEFKNV